MLPVLPDIETASLMLGQALIEARKRSIQIFESHVAEMHTEGRWLPDDVSDIRRRLESREIVLIEAFWLLIPPENRGDYWAFQDEYLRRENALRSAS